MKIRCENCGAWIESESKECRYCGSPIGVSEGTVPGYAFYDFGFSSHSLQWVVALVLSVLSALATLVDGRSFFTSRPAMVVWFGIIPLISFLTALFRRRRLASILIFFAFFLSAGAPFALINIARLGGYVDDSLGVGALIGGMSSMAYLLGLLVHWRLCVVRSRQ